MNFWREKILSREKCWCEISARCGRRGVTCQKTICDTNIWTLRTGSLLQRQLTTRWQVPPSLNLSWPSFSSRAYCRPIRENGFWSKTRSLRPKLIWVVKLRQRDAWKINTRQDISHLSPCLGRAVWQGWAPSSRPTVPGASESSARLIFLIWTVSFN